MAVEQMYVDGTYLAKHPSFHVEDSAWKSAHITEMLRRNQLIPTTVCDVGCGAGEILNILHSQLSPTTSFTGYDISPQAYALAKQRQKERLEFFCGNFLEVDSQIYDLLLCIDVFEHVPDYMGFLRELKPRAEFKLFHIPLDLSMFALWRISTVVRQRTGVGHLHYFTKETALLTLEDCGYKITDWFYTSVHEYNIARKAVAPSIRVALLRKLLRNRSQDLEARVLGGYSLMVLAK